MAERRFQTIRFELAGNIGMLTLDRPASLNALDPAMLEELLTVLEGLQRDERLTALIVTGSGRAFSAGVDIRTPFFMENVDDPSVFAGKRLLDRQHRLIEQLHGLPMLTIAAVNGDAIGGGGFGVAMACDLRVAVRTARFWMVPGRLAVVQDFGLSWLCQKQIGPSRTLQMAVLGEPVTADLAETWGLVNELVDDQEALRERLVQWQDHLGSMGTDALRMLKLVVRTGATSGLAEQLRMEAIANGLAFQSDEFEQRKAAYLRGLA